MSKFTDRIKGKEPEGGFPIFKFERAGDVVIGEFVGRRTVRTKTSTSNGEGLARALDIKVIESEINGKPGPDGPMTIFESSGITSIMDNAEASGMKPGDVFSLCFHSVGTNRFKKFTFEKLSADEVAELDAEIPF